MPSTVSQIEALWALLAIVGMYYPALIAMATGRMCLHMWREWTERRLPNSIERPAFVITFSPTLVMFILALQAWAVMFIFTCVGVLGMVTPPGLPREPVDQSTQNIVFRWALIAGLFSVIIVKSTGIFIAHRVFRWGESVFARDAKLRPAPPEKMEIDCD